MRSVPAMDATGYHALYKIYKRCNASGVKIILSLLQRKPYKMLNRYGFLDIIGKAIICKNIDESLMRAEKIISKVD